MTTLAFIERILVPALIITLLVGGIAGLAIGTALIVDSRRTLGIIACMNRWVSTRRALKPLEMPRSVEPTAAPGARHPLFGAFLIIGGALVVYLLAVRLHLPRVGLASGASAVLLSIALDAIRWILVAGAAAGVLLGLLMIVSPARYSALTVSMNRWYSTRKMIPPAADAMHLTLEPRVEVNPRAAGWWITGASLAVVLAMATLLVLRH
jgi:hypothetical protein